MECCSVRIGSEHPAYDMEWADKRRMECSFFISPLLYSSAWNGIIITIKIPGQQPGDGACLHMQTLFRFTLVQFVEIFGWNGAANEKFIS